MSTERTVGLADFAVTLMASTDDGSTYLDWFFGPLVERFDSADLVVDVDGTSVTRPDRPCDMHDGPIDRWYCSEGLELWHESGVGAKVTDGAVSITSAGPTGLGWKPTRQLLFSALSWWMDRRGRLLLHAGLVSRESGAALITGSTGSGKSTIAIAALVAGWALESDDLVVVKVGRDGPLAFGLPKVLMVDRTVASQLGLALAALPGDDRKRLMLPIEAHGGWRRVRILIRADHDSRDGRLRRLGHDEALANVTSSFLETPRLGALARQLANIAALACRPSFVLAHAADPVHRLTRAAELLSGAWERADEMTTVDPDSIRTQNAK